MKALFNLFFAAILLLTACNKKDGPSIPSEGINPVIQSLLPTSAAANATVTIKGKRFSAIPAENIVKFSGVKATVLSATDTLLTVQVPEDGGTGLITITVKDRTSKGPIFSYLIDDDTSDITDYITSVYTGKGVSGNVLGPIADASFNNPEGIAFDVNGDLLVADRTNQRIKRIANGVVSLIAGSGTAGYVNGIGAIARFNNPYRLAVNKTGTIIYIADLTGNRIRKIDVATQNVTLFSGPSTPVAGPIGFLDGTSANARFNNPIDMVVDDEGILYVVDNNNHAIRRIDLDGSTTTLAGDGTAGFSDGSWPNVKFNKPSGICIDNDGYLLVADRFNHRIRKIDRHTGKTTTIAGTGVVGRVDGEALKATFNGPFGINVDKQNNIYVADLGSHSIRLVKTTNQVITIGGTGSTGSTLGGVGTSSFNNPTDIDVDINGNIFIADMSNNRIIKMTPVSK
ncbi:Serine/threonine-protein kinase PknD [compost metagenome]